MRPSDNDAFLYVPLLSPSSRAPHPLPFAARFYFHRRTRVHNVCTSLSVRRGTYALPPVRPVPQAQETTRKINGILYYAFVLFDFFFFIYLFILLSLRRRIYRYNVYVACTRESVATRRGRRFSFVKDRTNDARYEAAADAVLLLRDSTRSCALHLFRRGRSHTIIYACGTGPGSVES